MYRVSLYSMLLIFFSFLAGCADELFFPRFDGGVLNPDIRFLRASEVFTGVKCAVVSFMSEREQELIEERVAAEREGRLDPSKNRFAKIEAKKKVFTSPPFIEGGEQESKFQPYAINATWQDACPPGMHVAPCDSDAGRGLPGCKTMCPPPPSLRNSLRSYRCPFNRGVCVPNRCNPVSSQFWDYRLAEIDPLKHTIPPRALKGDQVFKGCTPVPDYSRYALDPNQDMTLQLMLVGTNSGFINYNKIDANKLPKWLHFITPGGGPKAAPFPQMQPSLTDTTTFDMSVKMPQSLYSKSPPDPYPAVIATSLAIETGPTVRLASQVPLVGAIRRLKHAVGVFDDNDRNTPPGAISFSTLKNAQEIATNFSETNTAKTLRVLPGPAVAVQRDLAIDTKKLQDSVETKISSKTRDLPEVATTAARLLRDWRSAIDTLNDALEKGASPAQIAELTQAYARASTDLDSLKSIDDAVQQLTSKMVEVTSARDPALRTRKVDDAFEIIGRLENTADRLNNRAKDSLLNAIDRLKTELRTPPAQALPTPSSGMASRLPTQPQPLMSITPPSRTPQAAEVAAETKSQPIPSPGAPKRSTKAADGKLAVREEATLFDTNCRAGGHSITLDDRTEVDYLALKRMMHNVVKRQNETIYRGAPAVTLDSLILTTKFQIILEIQAGTQHILRIVPLIAPPNFEAKFDHAHQLKLTFPGMKRKGDPHLQLKLVQNCRDRVQDARDRDQCESTYSQLLESILETLENPSTGGGG